MPPKRNRPLTTQEAERMERAHRWKELAPSIRESPHIEAQSLLSQMEKGKLQSGEGSSGYWDKFSSSSSSSFCSSSSSSSSITHYHGIKCSRAGGAMMVLQGVPLFQKMVAAIQNPMPTFPRLSKVSTL
jgi:hypothetical protein